MNFDEDLINIEDYIENIYNTKTNFHTQEKNLEEKDNDDFFSEEDYVKYMIKNKKTEEGDEEEKHITKEQISEIIENTRRKLKESQGGTGRRRSMSNSSRLNFENVYLTQKKLRYNNKNFKLKDGLIFRLPENVFVSNKHLYDYYYTISKQSEEKMISLYNSVQYPKSDLINTSVLSEVTDIGSSEFIDPIDHFDLLTKMEEERKIVKAILRFIEFEKRRKLMKTMKKQIKQKVEKRKRALKERKKKKMEEKRRKIREDMMRKKKDLDAEKDDNIEKLPDSNQPDKIPRKPTPYPKLLVEPNKKRQRRNSKKPKMPKKKPKKKVERKKRKPKRNKQYYSYWYNCIRRMLEDDSKSLAHHGDVGYYSKFKIKPDAPNKAAISAMSIYNQNLYTKIFTIYSNVSKDMERDETVHRVHEDKDKCIEEFRRMSISNPWMLQRKLGEFQAPTIPDLGSDMDKINEKDEEGIYASKTEKSIFDIEYTSVYDF